MKKCIYKGKQTTLTDKEFLASGGQGDIYLHNGLIFKVYHSSIQSDFLDKIQELSVLNQPNIIRPLDVLYSATTNEPIGYTMDYADNTVSMPLLFTTSFLVRNNIQLQDTQILIRDMADTISFIHNNQILLVDGNEYNYCIDKNGFRKSYFLDTDSYQTAHHPATVIMPSVRDYTSKIFSPLTDWYSFATVTFQLFTGIHPYKGKHAVLKTVEERCKNHVSVFNPDVRTPPSVRDYSNIPANYLAWYQDMFEKGNRTPPPDMISAPQMRTKRKYVSAAFHIDKILDVAEPIKFVDWLFGSCVVVTEHFIYINGKQFDRHNTSSVVTVSVEGVLYETYFTDSALVMVDILRKFTYTDPSHLAKKWFTVDGRLYAIYESQLFEIELRKMSDKILAITTHTQPIAEQSSQVFGNVVYVDLFGKAYFYIPEHKAVQIYQQPLLDNKRILDAKYEKGQLIVIAADTNGTINRYRLATGASYIYESNSFSPEIEEIDAQEANVTVLFGAAGVNNNLSILYDSIEDTVDIAIVGTSNHKIIKDAGLPAGAVLVATGTTAHYFVGDTLYKFGMK